MGVDCQVVRAGPAVVVDPVAAVVPVALVALVAVAGQVDLVVPADQAVVVSVPLARWHRRK